MNGGKLQLDDIFRGLIFESKIYLINFDNNTRKGINYYLYNLHDVCEVVKLIGTKYQAYVILETKRKN